MPPGKQSQFDWGIFSYLDSRGTKRNIPGLYVTLGRSRKSYLEFALSADIFGLMTALLNAFFYFGGLTDVFLTDHMKTVVIGGNTKDGWEFNSQVADLANFLGIAITLCRLRRPQTKGKVERGIRYAKENFWPARTFSDLDGCCFILVECSRFSFECGSICYGNRSTFKSSSVQ
jgi:transposase